MSQLFCVAVFLSLASIFIWFRFFYSPLPQMPPLAIAPADPLMAEAIQKATATIPVFLALHAQPNKGAEVKIPLVTITDVKEYLWAEALSVNGDKLNLRYLTPPISHTGTLERLHTHPVSDLVDW